MLQVRSLLGGAGRRVLFPRRAVRMSEENVDEKTQNTGKNELNMFTLNLAPLSSVHARFLSVI